jgi:glycosidase
MSKYFKFMVLLIIVFVNNYSNADTITFDQNDATVWLYVQSIAGKISGNVHDLKLHCNDTVYKIKVNKDSTFKVMVKLGNGNNKIWATGENGSAAITSHQLTLTLGYRLLPDIRPYAVIEKGKPSLKTQLINNPAGQALNYLWECSATNPAACNIISRTGATTGVTIPHVNGAYYFNLRVISGKDTTKFQTYIVRTGEHLHPYDMVKDHAAWIDTAVIYEINPSVFVKHGGFDAITEKLAEIRSLGVNTIWLQPLCQTNDSGQGYSVTDYFAMRTDFGTEQQLHNLINTAKKLHFKIILDFVPNHISINHPYALDAAKQKDSSHYYSFFQHKNDGKPYSSNYIFSNNGLVSYFWENLVNLDYNNPEVQQWMIEAIKYWMLKYNLDGYRFDTMWGINVRTPSFGKRLNTELKSIKPDLLLLAEEKSSDKVVYQNGFDAAYDWSADTAWVSQWIFQTHYNAHKNLTVFNAPNISMRGTLLTKAVFNNSSITNRSLRFIENNDIPRFIGSHTLEQTKMAAALNFALPGIPMIYNGQEIGFKGSPYAPRTIFRREQTIEQADSIGLFPFYKKLVKLRLQYPQLTSAAIDKVPLTNSPGVMAFHRWQGNRHMIVIVNSGESSARAVLAYDARMKQYLKGTHSLKDLMTGNNYQINTNNAKTMQIPMRGYGIRYLLIEPNIN